MLHETLHGFKEGRGAGTATLDSKLLRPGLHTIHYSRSS